MLPSADWKAPTISVNESNAAGSVLEITKSIFVFNDKSPATRADASEVIEVDNEPSAAIALDSSALTSAILAFVSAVKSFDNETSEDIARDFSAFKEVSNDKSPATLEDASAVTAFVLLTTSEDKLEAIEPSAAIALDSSASTSAVLLTISVDKLEAKEACSTTLKECSVEIS